MLINLKYRWAVESTRVSALRWYGGSPNAAHWPNLAGITTERHRMTIGYSLSCKLEVLNICSRPLSLHGRFLQGQSKPPGAGVLFPSTKTMPFVLDDGLQAFHKAYYIGAGEMQRSFAVPVVEISSKIRPLAQILRTSRAQHQSGCTSVGLLAC